MKSGLVITFVSMFFCVSVFGGQVHLKNGDRLSGKVARLGEGKVTVETEYAGTVEIAVENIKTFSSDEKLEVHLSDGSVLKQAVDAGRSGEIKLAGSSNINGQAVALANVIAVNPPKPEKPRWKGEITTGYSYSSGNTNNEQYSVSGKFSKRGEKYRLRFTGDTIKKKEDTGSGSNETTEDWLRVGGKYDYFLTKKFYAFGEGVYETDEIAELDERVIAGGGGGYQWVEKDDLNFSTEVGVANVWEKYETADGTDSKFSLRAGYEYDQKFTEVFSVIHSLTYYPDVSDLADYYLTSTAELRARINSHLFANFKVYFDYDATPAAGSVSTDKKYIFGLGANW